MIFDASGCLVTKLNESSQGSLEAGVVIKSHLVLLVVVPVVAVIVVGIGTADQCAVEYLRVRVASAEFIPSARSRLVRARAKSQR